MFAKNLKYLRKQRGYTQEELSNRLGRMATSVGNWENGVSTPPIAMLSKISRLFNVPITDLMETDLSKPKAEYVGVIQVPIIANVSAGNPEYAIEDIIGYTVVPANEYINRNLFALEVNGDSMDQEFESGSRIIVDRDAVVENGQIAVVRVNGYDATVKQVRFEKDKIILIPKSNNDEHYPQVYSIDDEVEIIGKVVGSFKRY
ncbi:LexA family protein [Nosocomiicoccus ampullae]|uniref:LexA family protein n=1 Tax=Nosocomiicoccus ampullae TaxID=489910 RepID=UPI001C603B4C|nr:XRE family transcriptional regulator [Nosocomiicoccus ampullae]QYA48012.1 helix-turn-helix domain-containing protein [Nosocomiicoccus ampullae]